LDNVYYIPYAEVHLFSIYNKTEYGSLSVFREYNHVPFVFRGFTDNISLYSSCFQQVQIHCPFYNKFSSDNFADSRYKLFQILLQFNHHTCILSTEYQACEFRQREHTESIHA